jgi:small-conductance mechanosensitive channel
VGDRVEIGGIQGDVIDFGLIRTTLMETGSWVHADQQTGRVVTISNATALRQPVFNYTAYFPYLWDGLTIPVTFRSDWELAVRLISEEVELFHAHIEEEVAETLELMRRSFYLPRSEAKPGVYVRFTDNWIEISVRYLVPSRERRMASSELSQAILRCVLAEPGITIASETMHVSLSRPGDKDPA